MLSIRVYLGHHPWTVFESSKFGKKIANYVNFNKQNYWRQFISASVLCKLKNLTVLKNLQVGVAKTGEGANIASWCDMRILVDLSN